MIMRKSTRNLIAVCALLPFLGAGCFGGDAALVIDFVNGWLIQRGILDEDGDPSLKTASYVGSGGWLSTGNKENDDIIDAGRAVKGIKKVDEKVDEAHQELAKDPPDLGAAERKVDEALKTRPDDHHARNAKGVVLLMKGESGTASGYLASDTSCKGGFGNMSPAERQACDAALRDEHNQLVSTANASFGSARCRLMGQRATVTERYFDLTKARRDADLECQKKRAAGEDCTARPISSEFYNRVLTAKEDAGLDYRDACGGIL